MKKKKNILVLIITTVGLAALTISGSTLAQQAGIKFTNLHRYDLSAPGHKVVQKRMDMDPRVLSPRHTHPGEEIIYVLEGAPEYQLEGKPLVTINGGDFLFIPVGVIHTTKNVGGSNVAELANYVVEKRKPPQIPARQTP
jgi:quercetin dioxygenase-like cupin family protein